MREKFVSACTSRPHYGPRICAAIALTGLALEAVALKYELGDYTWSNATRKAAHIDTPLGRFAFVAMYVGFSAWFVPHILNDPTKGGLHQ